MVGWSFKPLYHITGHPVKSGKNSEGDSDGHDPARKTRVTQLALRQINPLMVLAAATVRVRHREPSHRVWGWGNTCPRMSSSASSHEVTWFPRQR
jgi:hypothetical protein